MKISLITMIVCLFVLTSYAQKDTMKNKTSVIQPIIISDTNGLPGYNIQIYSRSSAQFGWVSHNDTLNVDYIIGVKETGELQTFNCHYFIKKFERWESLNKYFIGIYEPTQEQHITYTVIDGNDVIKDMFAIYAYWVHGDSYITFNKPCNSYPVSDKLWHRKVFANF